MPRIAYSYLLLRVSLGLLVLLSLTPPCAVALPAGLLAWWSGNRTAEDSSGQGQHAMLMAGARAGVPGLFGGAFQLDGVDDLLVTPVLLPPQGTIDLWVNPTALDTIEGIFGTFGIANGDDRHWPQSTCG